MTNRGCAGTDECCRAAGAIKIEMGITPSSRAGLDAALSMSSLSGMSAIGAAADGMQQAHGVCLRSNASKAL